MNAIGSSRLSWSILSAHRFGPASVRRLALLFAATVLVGSPSADARGRPRSSGVDLGTAPIAADVDHVVDGDTVWVNTASALVDIRILGIDCPESKHNAKCMKQGAEACDADVPAGKAATVRAKQLLRGRITLEPGPTGFKIDGTGRRLLAYIRLGDGRDYGLQVIKEGLCQDFGWKYPHPRGAAYVAAEQAVARGGAAAKGGDSDQVRRAPREAPKARAQRPAATGRGRVVCVDGSVSKSCVCGGGSVSGCCSWHDGVAGCEW